jgi:hypothetical protein
MQQLVKVNARLAESTHRGTERPSKGKAKGHAEVS